MKKKIITALVIVAIIIAVFIYVHNVSVLTLLANFVAFVLGGLAGWFGHILYLKYKK